MYIKDPISKRDSVTLTLLIVGFVVFIAKVIISDMTIGTFHFGTFSASDFSIGIASLGGLYFGRQWTKSKENGSGNGYKPEIDIKKEEEGN